MGVSPLYAHPCELCVEYSTYIYPQSWFYPHLDRKIHLKKLESLRKASQH